MSSSTDRLTKKVLLRAPQARVWSAISDAEQFGAWFGVKFEKPFCAGQEVLGRIVPTTVDPQVAKSQEPYTGIPFTCRIESIEPMRRFAFRWHPFAIDQKVDYSHEPMTLVELLLEAVDGGTQLTITESGFDGIPLARRAQAFAANDGGWAAQTKLIAKYLERPAAS